MKLIRQSFEIIKQKSGLEGIYKQIELSGRTCYKSEDNITEDSARGFVEKLIELGHLAMLEHGTVYLKIPINTLTGYLTSKYGINKYCFTRVDNYNRYYYVTTNLRVLVEREWLSDLKYICEPTEFHQPRITVRFITDQGILREFTRHRTFSFAVESTRYCNYSKRKFNNEITYIYPCWLPDGDLSQEADECFKYSLQKAEQAYFHLLDQGWKPQQARNVLPLATKCEIVMTGFVNDWKHFFNLRCDKAAHPQAQELAISLKEEFIKKGFIDSPQ